MNNLLAACGSRSYIVLTEMLEANTNPISKTKFGTTCYYQYQAQHLFRSMLNSLNEHLQINYFSTVFLLCFIYIPWYSIYYQPGILHINIKLARHATGLGTGDNWKTKDTFFWLASTFHISWLAIISSVFGRLCDRSFRFKDFVQVVWSIV